MAQVSVQLNDVWCLESPLERAEGITETFTLKVIGAGTLSSPSAKAYKKKVDLTSTVFPSGSITASGNIVTLKPATGLVGTSNYVIAVTVTESGNIHVYKWEIRVQKAALEQ